MDGKKLSRFSAWSAFIMALMLVLNGITTFLHAPWIFWLSRIGLVLAGFGMLPAVWYQVRGYAPGWATWLTAISYLGLAAEALLYIGQVEIQTTWLLFGGLGSWAIGMNLISLLKKQWPLWLCVLGVVGGLLLIAAAIANSIVPGSWVNTLSAGLGAVVIYPAWLIWNGTRLLRD